MNEHNRDILNVWVKKVSIKSGLNGIEVDFDKLILLVEAWIEKNPRANCADFESFLSILESIVYEEIDMRIEDSFCKAIWLTK